MSVKKLCLGLSRGQIKRYWGRVIRKCKHNFISTFTCHKNVNILLETTLLKYFCYFFLVILYKVRLGDYYLQFPAWSSAYGLISINRASFFKKRSYIFSNISAVRSRLSCKPTESATFNAVSLDKPVHNNPLCSPNSLHLKHENHSLFLSSLILIRKILILFYHRVNTSTASGVD